MVCAAPAPAAIHLIRKPNACIRCLSSSTLAVLELPNSHNVPKRSCMRPEPLHPQHVDTGEVLMQAFADKAALNETLQTRRVAVCSMH